MALIRDRRRLYVSARNPFNQEIPGVISSEAPTKRTLSPSVVGAAMCPRYTRNMVDEERTELPIASATATGKVILLGEHAVVYGTPALAVPVTAARAVAEVRPTDGKPGLISHFPIEDYRAPLRVSLAHLSSTQAITRAMEPRTSGANGARALTAVVAAALQRVSLDAIPSWSVRLESSVPTSRGMGSSAAVAVATARAVCAALGRTADGPTAAELALYAERVTHGTPSGIDTSVISLRRAIRFTRALGSSPLTLGSTLRVVVGDSGTAGRTRHMVSDVKERRAERRAQYDQWIQRIGQLADAAVVALEAGDLHVVGEMMDENHSLLESMMVSTPDLERLIQAARKAGALGAKLSGGGGGGVMIALAGDDDTAQEIERALRGAGAPRVYHSTIAHTDIKPTEISA